MVKFKCKRKKNYCDPGGEKAHTHSFYITTFARIFSNIDFLLKILPLKGDELGMSEM